MSKVIGLMTWAGLNSKNVYNTYLIEYIWRYSIYLDHCLALKKDTILVY